MIMMSKEDITNLGGLAFGLSFLCLLFMGVGYIGNSFINWSLGPFFSWETFRASVVIVGVMIWVGGSNEH